MHLFLLGGTAKSNEKWIKDVEKTLSDLFESTSIQNYKHWQEDTELIDLDFEVKTLAESTHKLTTDYAIFAKSAGTLVTVKAVTDGRIKPKFCIFTGVPISWAHANNFDIDAWITNYDIKTLIIQNSHDPAYSFVEIEKYIKEKGLTNIELFETPGDVHHYPNLEQLHELIAKFKLAL